MRAILEARKVSFQNDTLRSAGHHTRACRIIEMMPGGFGRPRK